ncbi:methyltransferase domain-containing protein [Sphingomonas sp. 2R-10]|uniref:methyltransferase domain-containing protein n=1 Tax=Sphingomonas sp. 2R-10 TaxID=3045148 RepID=UPI000F784FF4|nr:methyltransferase domain-containing protein [Sphingomonas sp. 2R-10]MDJ0276819.1 methyltransferase domain-containing protein [Sphingomonas sp. 2R-10]
MSFARVDAEELMDDPSLAPETYAAVLRDLARVNTVTLAARPTLAFLTRIAWRGDRLKLLDVGYGDGDMLRRIARWAARRGVEAELVGIDLNPRSEAIARADTPGDLPITYRTGDYADLAGEGWDAVVSSLVAHHMTRAQLVAFVAFMERESARGWFVNDLHRHRFAHRGYPLLATLARWHPIVRADGTLSIARSYRPDDWPPILTEAGVREAKVQRHFPFRLCVERRR